MSDRWVVTDRIDESGWLAIEALWGEDESVSLTLVPDAAGKAIAVDVCVVDESWQSSQVQLSVEVCVDLLQRVVERLTQG